MGTDRTWFVERVKKYRADRGHYKEYVRVLETILQRACRMYAPQAVVQARAKAVVSFAEKILLKERDKGRNYEPTDLCGARVIVHTAAEVAAVCTFIHNHFEVDPANSEDKVERLKADQFGYRSVHYVVQVAPGRLGAAGLGVALPDGVCGLKAEIQVRTIAQHCWADISHDRCYKGTLKDRMPKHLARESGRAAALLEAVDDAFGRLVAALGGYESLAGAYLSEPQLRERLSQLQEVWEHGVGPDDDGGDGDGSDDEARDVDGLAHKLACVALSLGEWGDVMRLFSRRPPGTPALLFCLGLATCRRHGPDGPDHDPAAYGSGQGLLAEAAEKGHDAEARAALAETWLAANQPEKARAVYEEALEVAPTHPRVVGGYARLRIGRAKDYSLIPLMRLALEGAARACRDQVDVAVNLPGALYSLGEFQLLLKKPEEALTAYARAVRFSARMSQIDAALADLACYDGLEKHLPQIEWARRLLRRGKESKFGGTAAEATGPARPAKPSRPRAVVGVGIDGPDSQLVAEALRDFRGTRITGGPASGLPGPLDYWDGLLKGGVRPAEVQILTTGNGLLSFDCRLASMLGAQLAVLRPGGTTPVPPPLSFDEADPGLVYLPRDVATLRNFLAPPPVALFPTEVRDELAREFHESHRQEVMQGGPLAEWPALPEPFRQSSRELVDHIEEKLRHVGLKAYPVGGREVRLFALDETTHVEPMAELEHGRWNAERLRDGWTLGPTKDTAKKISPHLVAWADLPDGVRKWDRELVRAIPEKLRRYGWEVGPA